MLAELVQAEEEEELCSDTRKLFCSAWNEEQLAQQFRQYIFIHEGSYFLGYSVVS